MKLYDAHMEIAREGDCSASCVLIGYLVRILVCLDDTRFSFTNVRHVRFSASVISTARWKMDRVSVLLNGFLLRFLSLDYRRSHCSVKMMRRAACVNALV
jgi:hypothetical protein